MRDLSYPMSIYDEFDGRKIRKNIRKVGNASWVVPVPKAYGDIIAENAANQVDLTFYNDGILIITPSPEGYRLIGREKLVTDYPEELESKVHACYLSGYDRLEIEGDYSKFQRKINKIIGK